MLPIVALVGRSNVGKSTLFNRLTQSQDALVSDSSSLTRDRKYGFAKIKGQKFVVIDTGGIDFECNINTIEASITKQSFIAIEEADIVLFIVDASNGMTPGDNLIAEYLRESKKSVFLVANKIDGLNVECAIVDFYSMALGNIYPISALLGHGIISLFKKVLLLWTDKSAPDNYLDKIAENKTCRISLKSKENNDNLGFEESFFKTDLPVKIAIVGRPNVGKSTLINHILGEDRMVVHDIPGTTRDSIHIPVKRNKCDYVLIDTAGVRKFGKVIEKTEKFSAIKALQEIQDANVVLLIIDAIHGITNQDLFLLNFIMNSGRSLVIAINKWDKLSKIVKSEVKRILNLRLNFANFIRIHFVSALYGRGIDDLFKSIDETYYCSIRRINTSLIMRIMHMAIKNHQPPIIQKKRIRLKYAHIGGYSPLTIVIHGNQVSSIPDFYKRYLMNYFSRLLNTIGTPIRIQFQEKQNPFSRKAYFIK